MSVSPQDNTTGGLPEGMPVDEVEYVDDATGVVQSIMLMRIYDVLLLLLRQTNKPLADQLVEIHEKGEFVGPNPSYREPGHGA